MHKNKIIGIAIIVVSELYLSLQFYSREPEFPLGIFAIDAANAIFRDILLACIFMFFQKNLPQLKQVAHNYSPIVIVSVCWLVISLLIITSLKLIVNAMTIVAVLAGIFNNMIFVLLAGCIYARQNNLPAKALYFLSYFLTILFLYSDTIYFLITSAHIERILFDNVNSHSILGVLSTTDTMLLLGIALSFLALMLLFRTPKTLTNLPVKTIGAFMLLCFAVNLANLTTAYVYPQVLIANGFDEEGEIEKSRNVSRDLLSESVAVNLVREFCRDTASYAATANQLQRVAFSEQETMLLSDWGIEVNDRPLAVQPAFPYEKIIVIVAESFHRDYLHFYNPQIPPETTPFLDSLWAAYPHADHYYTANKPTTQGLNSLFLSQLIYSEEQSYENNVTLFKTLESHGYETMFLEATSQYYNDEFRAYKKRFGMQTYRAKEDLEKLGYTGSSGWGFHNDVMYEETINILEQNRNRKLFLVTKTIDSHQPYPYCGLAPEELPAVINAQTKNVFLKGIYWENITLKKFFHDLTARKLLDDKTLIIITSDHNPHPSQNDHYKRLGQGELHLTLAPIPLIFISANLQPLANFSSETFASQIDFAPTLLGILGIPSPPQFSGRNLLQTAPETGYALGCLGETLYYRSQDFQCKTDMYSETNQNDSEKAFIHWVQDRYVRYFTGHAATSNSQPR